MHYPGVALSKIHGGVMQLFMVFDSIVGQSVLHSQNKQRFSE